MTSLINVFKKVLNDHYLLVLVIFFVILVIIKVYISLLFSSPFNFGDEAIYEIQARSIFNNNFQAQSGYPIGYPLVLSIAYHLSSEKLVIYHLILIINSLLVTSIVFPIFFILRKYCDILYSIVGAIVISCLPEINVYSFMLMSENLFIPLFYFALWFLLEAIESDKKHWQMFAGFSIVALFFIRNTGIAMILGLIFLFFVFSIFETKNKTFFPFLSRTGFLWLSGFLTFLSGILFYYIKNLNVISYKNDGYILVLISNFSSIDGLIETCFAFLNEFAYIIICLNFLTIFIIGIFLLLFIQTQDYSKFKQNIEKCGQKKDEKTHSLTSLKILIVFFLCVSFFTIIITMTHMLGLEEIYNVPNYSILGRYIDPIIPGIYLFGFLGLKQIFFAQKNQNSKILISLLIINLGTLLIFTISNPFNYYNKLNIYSILYIEEFLTRFPLIIFALIGLLLSSFISYTIIKREKNIYIIHFYIIICVLISSFYIINIELSQSNQAGQFSDIGRYFDQLEEKNIYILWDSGDLSAIQQIHFGLTQFWCKYSLIPFSPHDEISGEFKNRTQLADYLISMQSFDMPIVLSSKSGYKLYQISSNPGQKDSLLFISQLTGSWNSLEREGGNGTYFRWIIGDANIYIYSDKDRNATISFEALSLDYPRYLVVNYPGLRTYKTYIVTPEFIEFHDNIAIKKGENVIIMFSSNLSKKKDSMISKNITVAIRNLSVE